jgi:hypothetical protein
MRPKNKGKSKPTKSFPHCNPRKIGKKRDNPIKKCKKFMI